jgi:hypothetical protein
MAIVLTKRWAPPEKSYFNYNPLQSYLENRRLCKTADNSDCSVTIESVTQRDFWGHPKYSFQSGETMDLSISFKCHGEVTDPSFWVIIQDRDDNVVSALNTTMAGTRLGTLCGRHEVGIRFGMVNLLPGAYKVTVGAWEFDTPNPLPPYPYDVHYQTYPLEIGQRLPGLSGAAYLPYEITSKKLND